MTIARAPVATRSPRHQHGIVTLVGRDTPSTYRSRLMIWRRHCGGTRFGLPRVRPGPARRTVEAGAFPFGRAACESVVNILARH